MAASSMEVGDMAATVTPKMCWDVIKLAGEAVVLEPHQMNMDFLTRGAFYESARAIYGHGRWTRRMLTFCYEVCWLRDLSPQEVLRYARGNVKHELIHVNPSWAEAQFDEEGWM